MTTYYHNNDIYIFDNHKFITEIPEGARWLVVGTFPTLEKNFEFEFYYSSKTNIFCKVIEDIFEHKFSHHKNVDAVAERRDFIQKNKIGMTDMIEACCRKQYSSQDTGIIPVKLRDVFSILDKNKSIDTIILTSRSGIISAEGLFRSLFLLDNKNLNLTKDETGVSVGEFQRGRNIKVWVSYSTSKSYPQDDPKKYEQVKKMYARCFDKHCR